MTGHEFKMIRERLALTQTDLGALLGFSRLHVQAMESDRREIQRPVELVMLAMRDGWKASDFA